MSVNTELLKNRDFRNTLFAIGAGQRQDNDGRGDIAHRV